MQVSDDMHGKLYLPRRLKIILGAILCLFVASIYMHARLHPQLFIKPLLSFFFSPLSLCVCVCKSRICFSARHRALPARLAICMDDSRSLLTSAEDALPINNVKDVGTRRLQ